MSDEDHAARLAVLEMQILQTHENIALLSTDIRGLRADIQTNNLLLARAKGFAAGAALLTSIIWGILGTAWIAGSTFFKYTKGF